MRDITIRFVPEGDEYALPLKYLQQHCQVFQGIDDTEFPPSLPVQEDYGDNCQMSPWPPYTADVAVPQKGGPASHSLHFRVLFRILCRENVDELPWTLVSVAKLAVEGFKADDEIKRAIFAAFLVAASKKNYGKEIWRVRDDLQLAYYLQDEDRFRSLLRATE